MKTTIEIKSIWGTVLFKFEKDDNTIKDTLVKAVKRGAYLQGADLQGAYLRGADLQGAYLQGAYLQGAYLRGAKNLKKIYQSDLSILNNQVNPLRAFKFLTADMESPIQNNKIKYEIGKEYKESIEKDKLEACGKGLNVATIEWCLREASCDLNKKYIEVEFNPKDLIVPYFSDGKFRVSKLKVIRLVSKKELKEAMDNIK